MNGIMNMVYFVHLCWILSSVISAAFATSETVSTSSVIFRSSLVSSRRTLLLPASEYASSSSPSLSSSALSGNVKSQPPGTITTEQISPTPIDTAELSLVGHYNPFRFRRFTTYRKRFANFNRKLIVIFCVFIVFKFWKSGLFNIFKKHREGNHIRFISFIDDRNWSIFIRFNF